MSRIAPLSGFPELLPEHRIVEQHVLDVLRHTFELHGFAGIETRSVEPLPQLLRKGDTSKEVYVLRRLQADAEGADAGLGLHFDLTVPFARFVVEHAGKLDFPFRRYQIQKAWRGERPQEGRYREFTQADIDVVGRDTLPFHHDVEVAQVMLDALSRLDFLPPFRLQVNNRKLVQGFYAGLGAPHVDEVMRLIDKRDKLPADTVGALLVAEAGLSDEQAARCLALAEIRSDDDSFVEEVQALGVSHPLLDEGLAELRELMTKCRHLATDQAHIQADLMIARGLDYYTGTVFETRLDGFESLGSICSGGRYDALAADGQSTYPGVGISLGVTRLVVPLLARGQVAATRKVPSAVLVAVTDEAHRRLAEGVAQALRRRDIAAEVSPNAQRFGKQIRHADRRGIPFVWFSTAHGHEVKDIRTGEQVAADPESWRPAETDLRPGVIVTP